LEYWLTNAVKILSSFCLFSTIDFHFKSGLSVASLVWSVRLLIIEKLGIGPFKPTIGGAGGSDEIANCLVTVLDRWRNIYIYLKMKDETIISTFAWYLRASLETRRTTRSSGTYLRNEF
jgi:hypothetical protein